MCVVVFRGGTAQDSPSRLLRSTLWVTQKRLVIAPTVEDADDRHSLVQHSEGINDPSPEAFIGRKRWSGSYPKMKSVTVLSAASAAYRTR